MNEQYGSRHGLISITSSHSVGCTLHSSNETQMALHLFSHYARLQDVLALLLSRRQVKNTKMMDADLKYSDAHDITERPQRPHLWEHITEEHEVMMRRITSHCEKLQLENNKVLKQNSRLIDTVLALEMFLADVESCTAREVESLSLRVLEIESKTKALLSKVSKNNVDIDLMSSLAQKHLKAVKELTSKPRTPKTGPRAWRDMPSTGYDRDMTQLALRRGRIASLAIMARRSAQNECRLVARGLSTLSTDLETFKLQRLPPTKDTRTIDKNI